MSSQTLNTENIQKIKTCLPEKLANDVADYANGHHWHYGWASNKSMGYPHWNKDFTGEGREGIINSLDVSNRLPEPISSAWNHICAQYLHEIKLLRCYVNAHTYGVEGYPHTDSSRPDDRTMVLYLNKEWRREWGGETMIYAGQDIVHAEIPKFNHGIIFPGNQFHVAKGVTRICPALRITLMFKFCPINLDRVRDNIQTALQELGTTKTRHQNGNLMEHLLRVYDLLKLQNYDTAVCQAGAFHSIFGTNVFQYKTIMKSERSRVVAYIGEEATELVELFGQMHRPQTLETALLKKNTIVQLAGGEERILTQKQLNSLCAIEAANLHDQNALGPFPNIKTFLKIEGEQ